MNTNEILKTDKNLHDFLQDHLLRGRVEKLMIKYHKEQLRIGSVSQQRELLNGFLKHINYTDMRNHVEPSILEDYLKTI